MYSLEYIDDFKKWKETIRPLEELLSYEVPTAGDWGKYVLAIIIYQDTTQVAACTLFKHLEQGRKIIFFGHLLVVNVQSVFDELIRGITECARRLDAQSIIGPMNGSTWYNYRVSASHKTNSYLLDLTHPEYYGKLFEHSRLSIFRRYFTYKEMISKRPYQKFAATERQFNQRGIQVRPVNMDHFERELVSIYHLNIEAFSANFLYTPINQDSFKSIYLQLKPIINPEFILLAENKKGELLGFIFCVENTFDQKSKGLIVKTIARKECPDVKGLGFYLGYLLHFKAYKMGYDYMLHAFMDEHNKSLKMSEQFDGELFQTYYLYKYILGLDENRN